MSIYLGIDFGTSTNYVVRWNEKKQCIEPISAIGEFGKGSIVENVISYGNENILGKNALRRIIQDPLNVVRYIKREIENKNWSVYIPHLNKELSTEDVCTDIFRIMKNKVEESHNDFIDGVVITVPFAFLYNERQKIKNAAQRAGIEVISLIEEPVAAAIRYLDMEKEFIGIEEKKVMVFDLGGGTLDVTIFKIYKDDKKLNIEVLNTDGNKYLGGKDIDDYLIKELEKKSNYYIRDIQDDAIKNANLKNFLDVAEEAKKEVCMDEVADIFINLNGHEPLEYELKLEEFEKILKVNNFLGKIEETIEKSINDIDLTYNDIDEIIMVGGSSRIIPVQNLIEILFDKKVILVEEPDLLVGEGAAIYCGSLLNEDGEINIIPRLSQSIGREKSGKFYTLISKNSKYGISSTIEWINVEKEGDVFIEVYQGNSENIKQCSKIGRINIDMNKIGKKEIGLKLMLNKYGVIQYKIYTRSDCLTENMVIEGELDE